MQGQMFTHNAYMPQALLTEVARIRLHGFSEREVRQAQATMLSDVESAYIERDQDNSQVKVSLFASSITLEDSPGRLVLSDLIGMGNRQMMNVRMFGTMWFCLTTIICLFTIPIKSLRTSLPGELRLAPARAGTCINSYYN